MNREKNREIHSELIQLGGVTECIKKRLKKLTDLRSKIADTQRKQLEIEIDLCNTSLKYLDSKETELRFNLDL